MKHDVQIPAGWNKMSKAERTQWLAKWFDFNIEQHEKMAEMERAAAEKARKNYRKKNRLGKRRK